PPASPAPVDAPQPRPAEPDSDRDAPEPHAAEAPAEPPAPETGPTAAPPGGVSQSATE
ncbi:MAG: hypothetical protein JWO37_656, partial [Acidimicrobiales bacterium]|nr:hypothetical protein [Acidimicrobiales bacterium]